MTIYSQVSGRVARPPRLLETTEGVKYFEFVVTHREQRVHLGRRLAYCDTMTISVFDNDPFKVAKTLRYDDGVMIEGVLRDRKLGYDRDVRINATKITVNQDGR
jgi:hypothetical protein